MASVRQAQVVTVVPEGNVHAFLVLGIGLVDQGNSGEASHSVMPVRPVSCDAFREALSK